MHIFRLQHLAPLQPTFPRQTSQARSVPTRLLGHPHGSARGESPTQPGRGSGGLSPTKGVQPWVMLGWPPALLATPPAWPGGQQACPPHAVSSVGVPRGDIPRGHPSGTSLGHSPAGHSWGVLPVLGEEVRGRSGQSSNTWGRRSPQQRLAVMPFWGKWGRGGAEG